MDAINGIVNTALIVVGSVAALVAAGAGVYFYYTLSGQEEGE